MIICFYLFSVGFELSVFYDPPRKIVLLSVESRGVEESDGPICLFYTGRHCNSKSKLSWASSGCVSSQHDNARGITSPAKISLYCFVAGV